ncbi:sushi, von Willebrand factor type A, EGF and pentraxin domain-containing protein 1-like isoform X2 [Mytilus edulis]|uniref:sushi, von Willebrand factor type A, EGF and pentraxin domain-containing protein 1-like isoform X2 n=1 Tax=Mytilus edulis TaxID=6550 RepID=UPI0039EEA760
MKSLHYSITLIASISMTIGSNVLNNVIFEMRNVESQTCSVESFDESNLVCNVPVENGIIRNNGTCDLSRSNEIIKTMYCYYGYLYMSNIKHQGRIKRASAEEMVAMTSAGAGIGAAFGPVGGVIGGAIGFVACLIFCSNEPEVIINKPPSITCGSPQPSDNIFAEPLATSAAVTWNHPSYSDPEGDSVSLNGGKPPSGSLFEHGYHIISYTATDVHGNMGVCSLGFRVTVNYCRESLYVKNGFAVCDPGDKIYGSVCQIHCNDGYQLTSDSESTKTCEGTSFSSGKIECERKKCSLPVSPCNGNYTCTNDLYEYDSVCYPKCNAGYETEMSRYLKCNGDSWEGTNTILACEDAEPPEFVNCPTTIIRYADRGSDVATNVTWNKPIIIDNSQQGQACGDQSEPLLKQVEGLQPGSDFSEGFHLIKYEAKDGNGLTAFCSFNVIIETISCDPLMPSDKFLISRCPTGYTYGSFCSFTCFLSYILKGNESVSCELDKSGKHGIWAWANDTESFCEKMMCPDLPAPANGALACSTVLGNQICTMACNDRFQTPLKPPSEFVCNDEQEWINGMPPNCTKRRNPNLVVLPGELIYFYSGDCSDTTVQQGIKEHFITVMEDLAYNRNWSNICPTFCNISDVTVTCGPTTGRRRRDSEGTYFKRLFARSTNAITLTFSLTMEWIDEGDYWDNDGKIIAVSETLEEMSTNGTFVYNGLSPATVAFSYSSMRCEEGSVPNYYTDTCSGCAPGTYLLKTAEECQDCAIGFYQDEEYQASCKQCPTDMSTEEVGSSSLSDCKDICQPGTYSNTRVVPCSVCGIGEYQPLKGSSTCLKCTKGKFTTTLGATDVSDCKDFDAMIPEDTQINFIPVTTSSTDFALSFWLFCLENCNSFITIKINGFTFDIGKTMTVSHSGENDFKSLDEFKSKTWIKVMCAWIQSKSELKVHVNEEVVLTKVFSGGIDGSLTVGAKLEMFSPAHKIYLSGLVLHTNITSDIYSRTCTPVTTDAVYTMSDFLTIGNSDIELLESQCDEINECISNPCGDGNICYNKKNGYNCTCLNGYRGSNCQTPPDFCIGNNCTNGATCESQQTNYTCQCANGYKGPFCEKEIVNGGWSSYSGWSECSKSCEGGTRSRVRFCDSPAPEPEGQFCIGSDTDIGNCNTDPCPVCKPYYQIQQFKNDFNCTIINEHITCIVTCKDGYVFLPEHPPNDIYECGNNTNYMWSDTPPACAPIGLPIRLQTKYAIKYDSSACTNINEIKNELTSRIQSLQCVESATCQVSVDTNDCGSGIGRRRRSTSELEIIVTFTSTLSQSNNLDMEAFYASKIVSQELAELINIYINQVTTAQQMINNTDFYTINVNGDVYTTNFSNINLTSTVSCSPGKVEYQAVCVACPTGTYWSDGFCILCSVGTYQNETGQQKCEACPNGYTTLYTASRNVTDCSETSTASTSPTTLSTSTATTSSTSSTTATFSGTTNSVSKVSYSPDSKPEDEEDNSYLTTVIIPVIIVVLLIATIIVTSVALFKYRKYVRRINRHKLTKRHSIASLNMVNPTLSVKPDVYGLPPLSTC